MRDIDAAGWARLRPLLDELLELDGAARPAALARLAAGDPTLHDDLAALLAADDAASRDEADAALARPVERAARDWLGEAAAEARPWVGREIGPFRILRVLGEGGMGIVFEAEQSSPRRLVALKVVRGGVFLDEARLRLFRREIEALARLQHPAIAAIYEAGRTDDGQHYFAMERVHGTRLDEWVRSRPAPATDAERRVRASLFLDVCAAIAYAHQRGVIHRDLKPSNIMVEEAPSPAGDTAVRAKVLDFGLARITDSDLALTSLRTSGRTIEGTLPYMSPEQARGDGTAVDVRSDVYSLGVILYELLTGARPYDTSADSLPDAVRAITETPPRRPSQHAAALRGDIEVILLKALEKDASARYASTAALADDLRRALADEPIAARAPSTREQLRRLARRHRAAVTAVALVAGALVLGTIGTTLGMLRARDAERTARRLEAEAREEARTAESVSRYLVGLFEASDPDSANPDAAAARRLLARGTAQLEHSLKDEPVVRARLYHTLGSVHRNLGLYPQARELLERAIALRREHLGPRHPDLATSEYVLAGLMRRLGEFDEAEAHYRRALDIRIAALGPDHRDVAGSWAGLANVFIEKGEYATALPMCRRALETIERALGPDDPAVATYVFNLALLTRDLRDYAQARALLERAIRLQSRRGTPDDPVLGSYRFTLAGALAELGARDSALAEARTGLALLTRAYGPEHAVVGECLAEHAWLLQRAGRLEAARDSAERGVAVLERAVGPEYWKTSAARDQLAVVLRELGRVREALALSERALRDLERSVGEDHGTTAKVMVHLAGHREALGNRAGARELYARALPVLTRRLGADDPLTREAARGAALAR